MPCLMQPLAQVCSVLWAITTVVTVFVPTAFILDFINLYSAVLYETTGEDTIQIVLSIWQIRSVMKASGNTVQVPTSLFPPVSSPSLVSLKTWAVFADGFGNEFP